MKAKGKEYFRCMLCNKLRENTQGIMIVYDKSIDVKICDFHKQVDKKVK